MLQFPPCLEQSSPCSLKSRGVKPGKALQQKGQGENGSERGEMELPVGFNCASLQNPIPRHPGAPKDTWNGPWCLSPAVPAQAAPRRDLFKFSQVHVGSVFLSLSHLWRGGVCAAAPPSWALSTCSWISVWKILAFYREVDQKRQNRETGKAPFQGKGIWFC